MSTARKKRQQQQTEKRSPSLKAIRQSRAYAVAKQEIEAGERKAAKRQAAQAAQITPPPDAPIRVAFMGPPASGKTRLCDAMQRGGWVEAWEEAQIQLLDDPPAGVCELGVSLGTHYSGGGITLYIPCYPARDDIAIDLSYVLFFAAKIVRVARKARAAEAREKEVAAEAGLNR